MSTIIQSLWVGEQLSPMEQKSIESFIRHEHEYHLYTYDDVIGVPDGVILKDANGIMPLTHEQVFGFPNAATLADFFRYRLLFEKGGWWSDTDAICIKPFDFETEFVFSSENLNIGGMHVNNGTIKVPANSKVMEYCCAACESMDRLKIKWAATGPALIQKAVIEYGLEKYVQQPEIFCPVNPWDVNKFMEAYTATEIPVEAYAVHLWNEIWTTQGLNKWKPVVGSYYDSLEPKGDTEEFDEIMKRVGV